MTDIECLEPGEKIKLYSSTMRKVATEIRQLKKKKSGYKVSKRIHADRRIQVLEYRHDLLQIEREMLRLQEKKEEILATYPWLKDTLCTNIYTSQDPNEKA